RCVLRCLSEAISYTCRHEANLFTEVLDGDHDRRQTLHPSCLGPALPAIQMAINQQQGMSQFSFGPTIGRGPDRHDPPPAHCLIGGAPNFFLLHVKCRLAESRPLVGEPLLSCISGRNLPSPNSCHTSPEAIGRFSGRASDVFAWLLRRRYRLMEKSVPIQ